MIALVALLLAAGGPRIDVAVDAEPPAVALAEGRRDLAADDPARAIESFRRAARADGRDIGALLGLVASYRRLGRDDEANAWLEVALAVDPASPDVALAYATLTGVQEPVAAGEPETPAALPPTRIERISDTEQRLVIGPDTREPAVAETLVGEATAVARPVRAVARRVARRSIRPKSTEVAVQRPPGIAQGVRDDLLPGIVRHDVRMGGLVLVGVTMPAMRGPRRPRGVFRRADMLDRPTGA